MLAGVRALAWTLPAIGQIAWHAQKKELNLISSDVFPVVEVVKNALAAMTISALKASLPGLRGKGVGSSSQLQRLNPGARERKISWGKATGAECAGTETPKISRGKVWGGVSPPHPTRRSGGTS